MLHQKGIHTKWVKTAEKVKHETLIPDLLKQTVHVHVKSSNIVKSSAISVQRVHGNSLPGYHWNDSVIRMILLQISINFLTFKLTRANVLTVYEASSVTSRRAT